MKKSLIIHTLVLIILLPCPTIADDIQKKFHDLESPPKLTISKNQSGWPTYKVESVKYHLLTLFIKSSVNEPSATYLLKEKSNTEITEGMEGQRSKIILELWELGAKKIKKRIWRISQDADKWQFSGEEELLLIKYGCCDSLNKYVFYDIKTGSLLRSMDGRALPVTTNSNK